MTNSVIQDYFSKPNAKAAFRLLVSLALLLTVYVIYRAAALAFTLDEGTTWVMYGAPSGLFPDHPDINLANHHLLNTWLMKLSAYIFGTSEFALRLPNVLGGILYLGMALLMAIRFSPVQSVLFFITVTCHPYVLQYFSLARGYGLAMAFLLSGVYFSWRYWQETKSKNLMVFCVLVMFAAALSNLTVVDFILPFSALQLLILLFHRNHRNNVHALILFTGISGLGLLAWFHGNYLEEYGALHWGGSTGIWEDTVSSICAHLLYDASYSLNVRALVKLFLYISFGVILFGAIWSAIRRTERNVLLPLLTASLILTLAFMFFLNYWRGTLFPIGRTGLFLVPLFIITLNFALHFFSARLKAAVMIYSSVFSLALLAHLFVNANFYQTMEWNYEADIKKTALDLHVLDPKGNQTLYTDWLLDGSMNYYRTRMNLPRRGQGAKGKPDLLNDWALIDVWRYGYPDPSIWKMHRCYVNNLVLFKKRTTPD